MLASFLMLMVGAINDAVGVPARGAGAGAAPAGAPAQGTTKKVG